MNLSEFIASANDISDESENAQTITRFLNDGIAKVNAECKANFPFMDYVVLDAEIPFPETWVRAMLLPFAAGRIKTKDSSQFEYSDLYAEFIDGLANFKMNYRIPDAYRDISGLIYDPLTGQYHEPTSDVYIQKPFGWMGW